MSNPCRLVCRDASLLVLAGLLAGCNATVPSVAEIPPPPVTVSQPLVAKVVDHDEFEGRIRTSENVEVRARVRGHLDKIKFTAGQMVKKGDLLYQIDPRPYKAALDAAKAQGEAAKASLAFARAEVDRYDFLVQKNAASREELESWKAKLLIAKGELLKAEAAIEQADLDLGFTKVTAKISGKISRTLVDQGSLVNAGGGDMLLTTIVSVDPMYVYFNVDERSLLRYKRKFRKEGELPAEQIPLKDLKIPVRVGLEGEEGFPHEGVLDYSDNKVNPKTGTMEVRGVLSNKNGLYEDGMRARVSIPVSDPYKAILVIERAIGTDQGRKFVYVVDDKDVAESRDVQLERVFDGLQVIGEGLKPGEWVVVNGIQRVRDGLKVQPNRVPMPGASAFHQAIEAEQQEPRK